MDEEGLFLEITDDYRTIQEFDVSWDYKNHKADKLYNTVCVSIYQGRETVAYLESEMFYDSTIEDEGYDLVTVADDSMYSDAVEAMTVLSERELPVEDNEFDFLRLPATTIYLHHIAVRDDYRGRGIGSWLLRNLPDILTINYQVCLGSIIAKLYPETITWREGGPSFSPDLGDPKESDEMFSVMKKLFVSNGYVRHRDTLFFIKDFACHEND